jgi:hypothetical protein
MNYRIEYTDSLGIVLTEQQKSNLSRYFKLTYDIDTSKLKTKIEYFGDDIINEGKYYMDSSENIHDVIEQINPSHRWDIMSDLNVINGYNVWKDNFFQNGELSDVYNKEVFNIKGDFIAAMRFDSNDRPIGGAKKFDLSNKNMIDEDGDIISVFETGDYVMFGFDSNGSFSASSSDNHIFWKPYLTLQHFLDNEQNGYVMNLMTEEMKNYYLNFEPLVPPFQI